MTSKISKTAARQGETAGRMRWVLLISTGLATLSLVAVALLI
jgi:hypothetical protein